MPVDEKKFPVGIAGVHMEEQPRKVDDTEPPPLPPNEQLKVVGKPTPRIDGRLKVTGAAKYTADVNLPGMLFARMITSPHPSAKIKSIDTSAAEKCPGFKGFHLLERDLAAAQTKEDQEQKYPQIRYAGQPIGAVAATSPPAAEDAVRLVKIEYEILPFVVDVDKAKQPDAPLVFKGEAQQAGSAGGGGGARNVKQQGNIRGPALGGGLAQRERQAKEKGEQFDAQAELSKAFENSDAVVESDFHTQVQTHSALETHGIVADYKSDGVTVYASTQGTASVRDELAGTFELQKSKIRVITEFMGGGFGAKFGIGNFGVLATQLSKKLGAPVRLMLDRRQEHLCVGNRPNSRQHIKLGAKKDGTLTAIHLVNFGTGGVGGGAGASAPSQNIYSCANILTEDSDVFTHAGPAAAFRAPGHPQGAFSLEQAMDELAEKLGIDPLELREKNDESDARQVERKIGAEKIGWKERKPAGSDPGLIKRGMGMAQSLWYRASAGPRGGNAHCDVRITQDGSVELMSGVQDIGGGIRTALAQVVAEELGLKASDVTVKIGDTTYPQGPGSGGSVTTAMITPAARNAAYQAARKMLEQVAPAMGVAVDDLMFSDGKVVARSDATKSLAFKSACKKLGTETISARGDRTGDYPLEHAGPRGKGANGLGGVQFAQVAVDTQTGVIKVEKVVAVHDCGRPINPMALESQINGGVIQGISYALYENRILDRNTGVMVNPNLEQYKIVGARETPDIQPIVIEQYWGKSSTDAGGIGEPATVPTAAAVANAVYNAIGVRIRELPMTPAVVLAALAAKKA